MGDPILSDLQALEHFVVENDALSDLEARVGKFNIFDALGVVHQEIRHSNFLAWLLDPAESHGLGPLFLKAVLMDLLRKTPHGETRLFSPIHLDGAELRGVEVRREWRNIDLLITCDQPSFVIAIENKVRSSEHSNQLARYRKIVAESRELSKFEKRQFVYLTPEGDEPSEDGWTVYSYADLHEALRQVVKASGGQMGDDVRTFLEHYLRLIGSRFMEDTDIAELCREIYKNHRQAIDLIVEHVASPTAVATAAIAEVVKDSPGWRLINTTTKQVAAVPDSWVDLLPAIGKRKKFPSNIWMVLNIRVGPKRCISTVNVWPTTDAEVRQRVIQRLIQDPSEFKLKSFFKDTANMGQRWATLGRQHIDRWKEDDEIDLISLAAKIRSHLATRLNEFKGIENAIRSALEE